MRNTDQVVRMRRLGNSASRLLSSGRILGPRSWALVREQLGGVPATIEILQEKRSLKVFIEINEGDNRSMLFAGTAAWIQELADGSAVISWRAPRMAGRKQR